MDQTSSQSQQHQAVRLVYSIDQSDKLKLKTPWRWTTNLRSIQVKTVFNFQKDYKNHYMNNFENILFALLKQFGEGVFGWWFARLKALEYVDSW